MAEYIVKHEGREAGATVSKGREVLAELRGTEGHGFELQSVSKERWELSPRVQGEIRPFSMDVRSGGSGEQVLTIRNHVFFRGQSAYMLTGIPEDVEPSEHVLGTRHINRLDKFPFKSLDEIDPETWGRLRTHRGVSVGTMRGLGVNGFKVNLSEELEKIGLPLSAALYLLYTTG